MTKYNLASKLSVQIGDLLVVNSQTGRGVEAVSIIEAKEDQISARAKWGFACESYDNAVVLKQDGTYLLGKNIAAWLESSQRMR